jgi:hypothetical protein
LAAFFIVDLVGFAVEVFGQGTKLTLSVWVSGAVGNFATFFGAFAEWVRV